VTPYRSARVEGRPLDPSRPRFGLAGAAVGAVCVFVSLVDLYFQHFTRKDNMLLFGGSAAIALLLAYSAWEAPAGRNALWAAVGVYAFSFVPQILVHEWMGEWVWGVRYLGVGAIAAALLVRLRRTRPGSYGVFLRGAAIVGTWWGLQMTMKLAWSHSSQTVRSELFSRSVYLLLAAGMLDMRRFVGGVPMQEAIRTPMHTAREIATTRICLALLSIGASLTALEYAWHSEWNVIAAAEALGAFVALAGHLPWMARARGLREPMIAACSSLAALWIGWQAYDARAFAPIAIVFFAAPAIAVDLWVARFAAVSPNDTDSSSVRSLAWVAAFLHALAAVVAVMRVS
jgi:hypothetical protein